MVTPHVKVSGTWKQVNKMHVKVSGVWKQINNGYVRVSGVWKKFLQALSPCSVSGSLDASGTTSTPTGTIRTVTVPAGNTGTLRFSNVVDNDGASQYSKNGSAWASGGITEGLEVVFADTDTLQIRGTGMTAPPSTNSFDLFDDDTGTLIEAVTVTRTS